MPRLVLHGGADEPRHEAFSARGVQRILVIGSGGAGKTTVAAELARRLELPLIHLDARYWRPGWQSTPVDEWRRTVEALIAEPRWVMDGNYGGTLAARLERCDTVVFLDRSPLVCLWRVLKRTLAFHGRSRPDMAPGCPERLTWEFVRWVWTYPKRRRPEILARLARLRTDQRPVVLRSEPEVRAFLEGLSARDA